MGHTFLALDMSLIPQATKDNIPEFWLNKLSNGNEYLLLDGYNDKRELVYPQVKLLEWLQWEVNPQNVLNDILTNAIEYTKTEIQAEFRDINSLWYQVEDSSENG